MHYLNALKWDPALKRYRTIGRGPPWYKTYAGNRHYPTAVKWDPALQRHRTIGRGPPWYTVILLISTALYQQWALFFYPSADEEKNQAFPTLLVFILIPSVFSPNRECVAERIIVAILPRIFMHVAFQFNSIVLAIQR